MTFFEIQFRLLDYLRKRVRNGDFTERGLARSVGLSQSHIHKVLRGARTLSIENADWILKCLHLDLLDLLSEDELTGQISKSREAEQAFIEVPCLDDPIGPGYRWKGEMVIHNTRPIPCERIGATQGVIAASLAHDTDMNYSQAGWNLALVDVGRAQCWYTPTSLYVVRRADDAVIRNLRLGTKCAYSVPDSRMNAPVEWEPVTFESILGTIVWIGRDHGSISN